MSEYHPEYEFDHCIKIAPKKFDIKNPDHRLLVMNKLFEKLNDQMRTDTFRDANGNISFGEDAERIKRDLIFYNSGLMKSVPSPWSMLFMDAAQEVSETFEKEQDPEYVKYLELKKKFEK